MTPRFGPETPDTVLVHAVRHGGSEEAFSLLYDRHTRPAFQVAWRLLGGSQADAEDAIQEAWMRAVRSLDRWRTDSPFGAWLRGIATHVAIDAVRKLHRFTGELDELIALDEPAGEQLDLESAIATLPPGYRAVLLLHDVEGFTHEEIGTRLGITAGTSKGQLFKARRAVRALLAPKSSKIEGRM
jgi:RNA polymerase sigma-70 factor (ECF subfamily)